MEFKQRSSGLPFKEMGSSPAKQVTNVPTAGPTDGVTAGDIETSKEEAERSLALRGNVVDILKKRKEKVKEKEKEK